MNLSPRRIPWTALITAVILVAIFEYVFFVPLRPTAWGGPRGAGPFEEGSLPDAGRWSRGARLHLESLAKWRSPNRVLDATAEALAGFYGLLSALRYGILWLILRRLSGCGCLAALATALAGLPLLLGSPRQTDADVGLLLFVMLLGITTPSRPSWWSVLIGIPVLFAVWANSHASVVIGLAWIAIVIVGRSIEWWKAYERDESDLPAIGRLLVASVLAAGAACANPDGPRIFVSSFEVMKNSSLFSLPDWQPIDFSKPDAMHWVYFGSIALLFLAQLVSPRAFSPLALVVVLSFGIWPLVQQRGADYWWLIAMWALAPQLVVVNEWLRRRSCPTQQDTFPHPALPPQRRLWWAVLLLLAVLATPAARWFITGSPRSLEKIVSRDTPARVALELTASDDDHGRYLPEFREQLRATYPSGRFRGAILGGMEQGDFLAWVLDGDNNQPIMVYTRPETLEPAHWTECIKALDGESPWWEILGRHQVNLIVIDPDRHSKLTERLRTSEEWRTVQDDGPGRLFVSVRREPKLPVELMAP